MADFSKVLDTLEVPANVLDPWTFDSNKRDLSPEPVSATLNKNISTDDKHNNGSTVNTKPLPFHLSDDVISELLLRVESYVQRGPLPGDSRNYFRFSRMWDSEIHGNREYIKNQHRIIGMANRFAQLPGTRSDGTDYRDTVPTRRPLSVPERSNGEFQDIKDLNQNQRRKLRYQFSCPPSCGQFVILDLGLPYYPRYEDMPGNPSCGEKENKCRLILGLIPRIIFTFHLNVVGTSDNIFSDEFVKLIVRELGRQILKQAEISAEIYPELEKELTRKYQPPSDLLAGVRSRSITNYKKLSECYSKHELVVKFQARFMKTNSQIIGRTYKSMSQIISNLHPSLRSTYKNTLQSLNIMSFPVSCSIQDHISHVNQRTDEFIKLSGWPMGCDNDNIPATMLTIGAFEAYSIKEREHRKQQQDNSPVKFNRRLECRPLNDIRTWESISTEEQRRIYEICGDLDREMNGFPSYLKGSDLYENHLKIVTSKFGIVPLRNKPPARDADAEEKRRLENEGLAQTRKMEIKQKFINLGTINALGDCGFSQYGLSNEPFVQTVPCMISTKIRDRPTAMKSRDTSNLDENTNAISANDNRSHQSFIIIASPSLFHVLPPEDITVYFTRQLYHHGQLDTHEMAEKLISIGQERYFEGPALDDGVPSLTLVIVKVASTK